MMELMFAEAGALGAFAAWILTYLAHSTLLLATAWLASRLVGSLAFRDLMWKVAAAGPLLTATAALVLSRRQDPGFSMEQIVALAEATRPDVSAPLATLAPAVAVVMVWLVGACLGMYRLEQGRRRYWRWVGRRETLADSQTVDTLRRLQAAAGCSRTVYLTTSEGIGAPAAIGSAEICLPADSLATLSAVQRESVLAHELGHLIRRDPRWRFAVELLTAVFLIQPLLRLARREMREGAEMLCDDFAIQLTGLRRPLVESLALLAASLRPNAALAIAFGEGDSPLVRRAARVLDGSRQPIRPVGRAAAALLTVTLLTGTLAFAPSVAAPRAEAHPKTVFFSVPGEMLPPPANLSPGVKLTVQSREGEQLTVHRNPDGELRHEYSRAGVVTEPDARARRWISEILDRHGSR